MPAVEYQTAAFNPKVIGVAGCISVRPSMIVAACASESRRSDDDSARVLDRQHRPDPREEEDECRVGHVLAGGAPVHVGGAVGTCGADARGERGDERNRRGGRRAGLARDRDGVEGVHLRGRRDGVRGRDWNDPGPRLDPRQRDLEIEHGLQHGGVGERVRHGVARGQRVDQAVRAHRSKNTVSPSPCRRISHSQLPATPADGVARSVARRSAGTSESSGSVSRSGSPAK